ncbi:hypothetical protein ACWFRK_00175 [Streptomyces sp. NPDC055157]
MGLVIFGGLRMLSVLAVDELFPVAARKQLRLWKWLFASLVIPVPYLLAITVFEIFK